jgi:hypothetical protein
MTLGDAGDLFPNGAAAFNDSSMPNTRDYDGNSTGIMVDGFTGAGTANMTCAVTPRSNLAGYTLSYDAQGTERSTCEGFLGYADHYGLVRFTAGAAGTLERVKTYFDFSGNTTYTISVYSGWSGGEPTGLLTSQSGSNSGRGCVEIMLDEPQSIAAGADFYVEIRYNAFIYTYTIPIGRDPRVDNRSWFKRDGLAYSPNGPVSGVPKDLNIRVGLGTVPGEVVSLSLNGNSWDIGPIAFGDVVASPTFTVTNDGTVPIDLAIKATNAAGGWTLSQSQGANAFVVNLTSPSTTLTTSEQNLANNVAVSGTKGVDLTYRAPTSDTFGGGVDQGFTVTVTATEHIP